MAGNYFGSDYWRSDYFAQGGDAPAGAMRCSMSASAALSAKLTDASVAPPVLAPPGHGVVFPRRRVARPDFVRRVDYAVPARMAASLEAASEMRATLAAAGSMSVLMTARSQLAAEGYADRRGLVTRQDNTFWLMAA